jgi:hypothetical protein
MGRKKRGSTTSDASKNIFPMDLNFLLIVIVIIEYYKIPNPTNAINTINE